MHASGTFEVKLSPLVLDYRPDTAKLGRMSIYKHFHGDLEALSNGEMLTASGGIEGSAGYVAIERVKGKLHGHNGTFVLQHNGTMKGGEQELTITVVPDSGTEELTGLSGRMEINIVDEKHSYEFEYTIA